GVEPVDPFAGRLGFAALRLELGGRLQDVELPPAGVLQLFRYLQRSLEVAGFRLEVGDVGIAQAGFREVGRRGLERTFIVSGRGPDCGQVDSLPPPFALPT